MSAVIQLRDFGRHFSAIELTGRFVLHKILIGGDYFAWEFREML